MANLVKMTKIVPLFGACERFAHETLGRVPEIDLPDGGDDLLPAGRLRPNIEHHIIEIVGPWRKCPTDAP